MKKGKSCLRSVLSLAQGGLLFLLLQLAVLSEGRAQGTGVNVNGTVTGDTGEPLAGVSVSLKGSPTTGTVTGNDGRFSLRVPNERAVLLFSMSGYTPREVAVGANLDMNVVMNMVSGSMSEVVVVGYGTQAKKTLTGAVATIRSAEINTTKSTSVVSNIQGKVPGLLIRQQTAEPGQFNSLVSIRGFGTPLLVIDGVPRDNMSDFERLNPEDIESISVLKDAAAAIYGMNADNGVIIVTTKKGHKGKGEVQLQRLLRLQEPHQHARDDGRIHLPEDPQRGAQEHQARAPILAGGDRQVGGRQRPKLSGL